jgi:HAD superfamily hydrolase (TIGR01549 family)
LTKLTFKKKLVIFDLDGVLIDSKINMKFAWRSANRKFKLKIPFKEYFKNVGMPYNKILKNLKVKNNIEAIEKEYGRASIINIKKIKLYKDVKKTLKFLKKKQIKTAIVTSKSLRRTKKILKLLNIKVDALQCPSKKLRGKPYPDQILKIINKMKISKKYCIYVGDTKYDAVASKMSNIDFAFAMYGYKIGINKSKINIKNIFQITKFI